MDIANSAGRKQRLSNDAAALTAALEGYPGVCANMMCEATIGFERALLQVAAELARPLRRVHPNRAHAFAKTTGQLGKTDALDAQMFKTFAAFTAGAPAASPNPRRLPPWFSRLGPYWELMGGTATERGRTVPSKNQQVSPRGTALDCLKLA